LARGNGGRERLPARSRYVSPSNQRIGLLGQQHLVARDRGRLVDETDTGKRQSFVVDRYPRQYVAHLDRLSLEPLLVRAQVGMRARRNAQQELERFPGDQERQLDVLGAGRRHVARAFSRTARTPTGPLATMLVFRIGGAGKRLGRAAIDARRHAIVRPAGRRGSIGTLGIVGTAVPYLGRVIAGVDDAAIEVGIAGLGVPREHGALLARGIDQGQAITLDREGRRGAGAGECAQAIGEVGKGVVLQVFGNLHLGHREFSWVNAGSGDNCAPTHFRFSERASPRALLWPTRS